MYILCYSLFSHSYLNYWNLSISISLLPELSSLSWLRRSKSKIDVEPTIHYHIHAYIDPSNSTHLLESGNRVLLGIRKLEGMDYAIGVIENDLICPMIDARGIRFILNMNGTYRRDIDSIQDIPYGTEPQHTVQCRISDPPGPNTVILYDAAG